MKLAILGGGGFRVPLVYGALLADSGTPRVDRVALYDPDPDRLAAITQVLARQADGVADAPIVEATTNLDVALEGSRFVFSAVRVGGLAGRTVDERVALRLGVLGQETTGPGGLAYGLRTIPVARHIAERTRALAPEAYVINFTNPAGMITEAMREILGDRVVGICDTPLGLGRRAADAIGLDAADVHLDYVGLNHLGWLRGIVANGENQLPRLLADETALLGLEEGHLFGAEFLNGLGALPNEYLYYYYFTRDAVRSIVDGDRTRGEFLLAQQAEFYTAAAKEPDRAYELWVKTRDEREASYMAETRNSDEAEQARRQNLDGGGYEGVALALMAAIARNERASMILNVGNGGTVAALPADAVIEVPCTVDAGGVRPLATTPPNGHQIGMMQQLKTVERHTIRAATTGDPTAALMAFALHPLVDSVTVARQLLDGYLREMPGIAEVLGQ